MSLKRLLVAGVALSVMAIALRSFWPSAFHSFDFGAWTISAAGAHDDAVTSPEAVRRVASFKPAIPGHVLLSDGFENGYFRPLFDYSGDGNTTGASIVASPVRSGTHAVKIVLDRSMPNKYRTELQPRGSWQAPAFGSTYWYAFSIYLPVNWVSDPQEEIIAQWHGRPDKLLGEGWRNPPLAIYLHGDQYILYRRWDSKLTGGKNYDGTDRAVLGTLDGDRGKWTDWVFEITWSYKAGAGLTRVWKDGVSVYDVQGPNCFNDRAGGPYFKFGIYKWPWKRSGKFITSRREIYYDDIVVTKAK